MILTRGDATRNKSEIELSKTALDNLLNRNNIESVNQFKKEKESLFVQNVAGKQSINKYASSTPIVPEIEPEQSTSSRKENAQLPTPTILIWLSEIRELFLEKQREIFAIL